MEPSLGLLLLVPGIITPLEPLELSQRRRRRLVQQQRHGLGLLRLGHQHGMAAQHDGLVLQLVTIDPGKYLGQAWIGHTVGDPVQQRCPDTAPCTWGHSLGTTWQKR
uniref:Uncharacterized protein n=1 Tax=Pygocentrus nattereri TaxID=42514 RepID=A0A3B4CHS7_PYGNA